MKKIIIGFLSAVAVAVGLSSCDLDAVVYSEMTTRRQKLTRRAFSTECMVTSKPTRAPSTCLPPPTLVGGGRIGQSGKSATLALTSILQTSVVILLLEMT